MSRVFQFLSGHSTGKKMEVEFIHPSSRTLLDRCMG